MCSGRNWWSRATVSCVHARKGQKRYSGISEDLPGRSIVPLEQPDDLSFEGVKFAFPFVRERIVHLRFIDQPRRNYGDDGLSVPLPVSGWHPLSALRRHAVGILCRRSSPRLERAQRE